MKINLIHTSSKKVVASTELMLKYFVMELHNPFQLHILNGKMASFFSEKNMHKILQNATHHSFIFVKTLTGIYFLYKNIYKYFKTYRRARLHEHDVCVKIIKKMFSTSVLNGEYWIPILYYILRLKIFFFDQKYEPKFF